MTPKEKAKELVNKFIAHAYHNNNELQCKDHAKQCALIVVDEILKSGCTLPSGKTYYGCNEEATEYWQEVKHEIELL